MCQNSHLPRRVTLCAQLYVSGCLCAFLYAYCRYYQHEQSQAPVGAHTAGAVVSSGSHSTSRAGQAGRQFSAEQERDLFRLGVSVSKYFITKRLPGFTYECMEVGE